MKRRKSPQKLEERAAARGRRAPSTQLEVRLADAQRRPTRGCARRAAAKDVEAPIAEQLKLAEASGDPRRAWRADLSQPRGNQLARGVWLASPSESASDAPVE